MKNNEIIYRKTFLKNIYCMCKMLPNLVSYDDFKKIILFDLECNYEYCDLIKKYYIALNHIVENNNYNYIEEIKIVYSLIFNKNIDGTILINNISDDEVCLEMIVKQFDYLKLEEYYIFTCILIQLYLHYKYSKLFRLSNLFFEKLFKLLSSNNFNTFKEIINNEVKNNIFPDKEYYKNLIHINTKEVVNFIEEKKDYLKKELKIKNLYLSGSFAKQNQRIDSDIDFICEFEDFLSYEEKRKLTVEFKEIILNKFSRYGDLMEFNKIIIGNELYKKLY